MACGGKGQPPCKQTVAKPAANHKSSKKSKNTHLEKIAVKPNLPVENLLSEFLRQQLAPDPNDGNNYYIGVVVQVLTQESNLDFGIFDIFSDSTSNLERFYNDKGKKTKEAIKKVIVHIPELYSTSHLSLGNAIFLETKFKINYYGNDTISENDIVKVVFRNTQTFSDPEIISIQKSDGSNKLINIDHKKIYDIFNDNKECKNLLISTTNLIGADQNSVIQSTPYAGYKQLFSELKLISSEEGFELFRMNEGENSEFIKNFKENFKFRIHMSPNVDGISGITDEKIKGIPFDQEIYGIEQADYEVGVSLIIKKTFLNAQSRLEQFSNFLKDHTDKYGFNTRFHSPDPTQNFYFKYHVIDIAVVPVGKLATFDEYKKISEKLESGGNLTTQNENVENTPNSATSQANQNSSTTIQPNNNPENCPVPPPTTNEFYIDITNKTKWKRKEDLKYIDYFLNNSETSKKSSPINYIVGPKKGNTTIAFTDVPIKKQNLMLSGELFKKNNADPFYKFEQLEKENKKFYNITESARVKQKAIEINSSLSSDKNNFITKKVLELNLDKIELFLTQIRLLIANNEFREIKQLDERLDRVLVLPINIIRKRTSGKVKFPSSRHYFGLAVDFVVYIKDIKTGNKIYQIPPNMIFLYARKVCKLSANSSFNRNGNGVYLDSGYNHFEILYDLDYEENPNSFLNDKEGFTSDERENGKIWSDRYVWSPGTSSTKKYQEIYDSTLKLSGNDIKVVNIKEN